jgi:tripartite-type tricarboxylate transporter receptor subunit TctC
MFGNAWRVLAIAAGGLGILGAWSSAFSQAYPARPVVMIVPYAPGGTGEVLARLLAQKMSEKLGQNVVVELRPGAGGNIGAEYVAKTARADGYTFLLAASSLATSVSLMKLPFDPRKDLVPVAGLAAIPNLLVVSAEGPHRSVADLVDAGKRDRNALTYGSSGNGTGSHLAGELFRTFAGVPMTHVPYKGSGAVYPDLIAGRVTMLFDVMGSAIGQVKGGRVRPLAITSSRRSPALPEVPTVAEQGYRGYEFVTWFGFFAPAAAPAQAVAALEQATIAALQSDTVKERMAQLAAEPVPARAAEFGKYFLADVESWAKLVREGKVAPLQ